MITFGLVMAGGSGRRMKQSGIQTPKPLVRVAGRSLLECAILWQIEAGVSRVLVSIQHDQRDVLEALERLVRRYGSRVEPLIETEPLGNAGALFSCQGKCDRVLFSFADNLSSLEGARLLAHHEQERADATLAAHRTAVRFPFGVLSVRDGLVRDYVEKPPVSRLIASGYAVFDVRCLAELDLTAPIGLADLARGLLAAGRKVAAFHHDSTWVDVNRRSEVERAESLAHPSGGRRAKSWWKATTRGESNQAERNDV